MDEKTSATTKLALGLWVQAALEHIKLHPEHLAELAKAINSDTGDVRVVYHTKANAIAIETLELVEDKWVVRELYRDIPVRDDAGSPGRT
jgi:hypothetical protein